jgi:hypothetical protein
MTEEPRNREQAAEILERWIRFRELQVREAAKEELAAAARSPAKGTTSEPKQFGQ